MWITCLDRVSANAAKGRGREREERMGERLQSRFGKSGEARNSGLVQIVVEVSEIRGGLPSTWPFEPVFGWRGRNNGNKVVQAVISLQKNLSRKISPEKSLDFLSRKSVLRPA